MHPKTPCTQLHLAPSKPGPDIIQLPPRLVSTLQLDWAPLPASPTKPSLKAEVEGQTFHKMFGAPKPAAGRQQRPGSRSPVVGEQEQGQERRRKPLPVSPLTGQVLGPGRRQEVKQEVQHRRKNSTQHSQLW